MIKRVLIANRGEIAIRIIRACKELGIETVAIFSEADRDSMHVRLADYAVCIGPPPPAKSYLNIPAIISAAEVTGADAIHPGYGFLAENPTFAQICEENGFKFIGPSADAIKLMGDKIMAKEVVREAGVPVIPGSHESVTDIDKAIEIAESAGFPVMIKAAAGGGGKGMRIARNKDELKKFFNVAQQEAKSAFGDGRIYIEKYLIKPRHIEVQILGDEYGNVVHLGERECSIQRKHQKLIEEAPSPIVTPDLRKKIGEYAVKAAQAIGYFSAGTVEFLMDQDGNFYFIEMNTRIQVEHPVTEFVTGIDIVKEQLKIASGEPLSFRQEDVKIEGHAIECRINAEDPDKNFQPCPGKITMLYLPGGGGVRVDTHVYQGYTIPPHYDSLIAKLIVHGKDRIEAIERMKRALDEFIIEGIKTTIPFHRKIMEDEDFVKGNIHTSFIEQKKFAEVI